MLVKKRPHSWCCITMYWIGSNLCEDTLRNDCGVWPHVWLWLNKYLASSTRSRDIEFNNSPKLIFLLHWTPFSYSDSAMCFAALLPCFKARNEETGTWICRTCFMIFFSLSCSTVLSSAFLKTILKRNDIMYLLKVVMRRTMILMSPDTSVL